MVRWLPMKRNTTSARRGRSQIAAAEELAGIETESARLGSVRRIGHSRSARISGGVVCRLETNLTVLTHGPAVHHERTQPNVRGEVIKEDNRSLSGSRFLTWRGAIVLIALLVVGRVPEVTVRFPLSARYDAIVVGRDAKKPSCCSRPGELYAEHGGNPPRGSGRAAPRRYGECNRLTTCRRARSGTTRRSWSKSVRRSSRGCSPLSQKESVTASRP